MGPQVQTSCQVPKAKVAGTARIFSNSLQGQQLACRSPAAARPRAQRRITKSQATETGVEKVTSVDPELAETCINAIRFLAIDAVNKANSGHPGLPMGCAPLAFIMFHECMLYNPKDSSFFNRDRFTLSAGHGSMLQYAMLHFSGFDVTLEDCKNFRQLNSRTPGHPENFLTDGVEITTGPLGQGIANAVGIAAAEAHLAARFNKDGLDPLVDHYTWSILGDGCNMEGISNEAASLAGHWGLGKLIAIYDDNKISIDGHTDLAFTEDVGARFEALGWHVQHVADGNKDYPAIKKAIENAKACTDKPSLIRLETLIGYGSPNKANTHGVHGSPLGGEETGLTRENLGWKYGEFEIPKEVYDVYGDAQTRGKEAQQKWEANLEEYCKKYPEEGKEFKTMISGELPSGWADCLPKFGPEDKGLATRLHSQTMLNALAGVLPGFLGGSADLAPSNMTLMKAYGDFQKGQYQEKNFRFGVREHAMGAICNGMALHNKGLIPYCATFFIFTDYMRASIRMAALSEAGVIFVMTHDSIGLGEDGPTHQPIEHLASLRAMPNILMMRPGDGNETAGAYKVAVENCRGINKTGIPRPTVMAFSRQGMPNMSTTSIEGVEKGAYIVRGGDETPDVILMGTGSELSMAVEAAEKLEAAGKKVRVVSFVCWELFEEQEQSYKDSILPPSVENRVSVEAGSTFGWVKYTGAKGKNIGIDHFGASGPAPALYEWAGITVDAVVKAAS
ncbi:hypothetical protein WJX84_000637 [Apatococcus fuscideae]|uniref:transketolase n=1 Tax=Apatococcus fuscideae TaxID=2026836 RepID=A0AAW1SXU0_9CHLO